MFTRKPMRQFEVLLFVLILQGCANTEEWPEEMDYCAGKVPNRGSIRLSSVFELHSWDLEFMGKSISVECDYTYKIQERDYEACRDYARAAVTYLNQNNQFISGPIKFEDVTYSEEGICIDTFIPGREAADCFDFVQFKVPLGELQK